MSSSTRLALCLGGLLPIALTALAAPRVPSTMGKLPGDPIDFNRDVRPILNRHCIACHGADDHDRAANLRLDRFDDATTPRRDGVPIAPGKPEESLALHRITDPDDARRMPPPEHGPRLEETEIAVLERWIEEGAAYQGHWALRPRRDPAAPAHGADLHPIDAFLRRAQEREGLQPAPRADRRTLLRRVSFDLIGLPPTPEEVTAFARDPRPDAWERAVDRLLAHPAFGERWASPWLDLARYADSAGYGSDPLRTIWRYRDWVIDALNANGGLDAFTIEQLAGDLLDEPTMEQKLATAFHRNTMTNTEGGTDDEEFRVAAVKDRVNTTSQVWLGLTMGCAECHSHKYDPITHREYYQFFAFFNQTADRDRNDEAPRLETPTLGDRDALAAIDRELEARRAEFETPAPVDDAEERAWESTLREHSPFTSFAWEGFETANGTVLDRDEERDCLVATDAANPDRDTYVVFGRSRAESVAALRLEVLPDERFAMGGPGRGNGNFVLNDLRVRHAAVGHPAEARTVRIELPGKQRILSLAEVEVFAHGENTARTGTARQSSTGYGGTAARAIDGNPSGVYEDDSTTHTNTEDDPWWEVDLGRSIAIESVRLWNRTDGDLEQRLAGCRVVLLDEERKLVWQTYCPEPANPSLELDIATHRPLVRIARATSSFDQAGWDIGRAVDLDRSERSGWAISPRQGEAHEAVFQLESPIAPDVPFALELQQTYGSHHTLGRFRVSTSPDGNVIALPRDVRAIFAMPREQRDESQRGRISAFHRSTSDAWRAKRERIEALTFQRRSMQPVTTPVMVELPANERRTTHVLVKGNFLAPGEAVEAATPSALHDWPHGAPHDRLGLARWLVAPDNPLTARVFANRFWARLLGRGLVESEEDFGTQGSYPSHPELLDWLASRLVESGWDLKAFLRTIVTSETYARDARLDAESAVRDPANTFLARGPRFRLSAEMVRDQALAVGGLLVNAMRGPSVYPPQPDGLWQPAFNGQRNWPTSRGADRYRRALYTYLRRTVPYPAMATFDAPNRELCTVKRTPTNTPLQAFVTWNDPAFLECSQALARRMVREGGDTLDGRLARGYALCLQRTPSEAALDRLRDLYESARAQYANDTQSARAMAETPLGPLPRSFDLAETAALTVVANVLLNLDATLTRG
ncbi:MAG: DUF1553 domain-containing protein [Planctomycetes bacterium]|nr:DUF1553 domain-containing protein [Planctomycetota bacterium]